MHFQQETSMKSVSFSEFADFVRVWGHLPKNKQIDHETQFERDLGITGDDGSDLLIATEKKFGISLSSEEDGYRKTFNLGSHEYLFNSEGFGVVSGLITIFSRSTVRAFTVGELYSAVKRTLEAESE
jgi:acyl carrier protein